MPNKKIVTLVTESSDHSPAALNMYRKLGPVYLLQSLKSVERAKILSKINLIVTGLSWQLDKKLLDKMPNLKVVATNTTGLNHVDVGYLKKNGIKLICLRGRTGFLKNIPSTAEETFALIFALVRNIPWSFDDVKAGRWDRLNWRGHQLQGKTIGLLGFGRLGKIVARYARAFRMNVIASDPYVSKAVMDERGVKKVSADEIFKKADIVSLHVLLTDKVYNLVKEKHLKMMKRDAYFINTARAELIEKGALLKALKRKWIAGAAIDVMWDELPDGSHLKGSQELAYTKKNNNFIIVPHIGGATIEATHATQDFIAGEVFKYFHK